MFGTGLLKKQSAKSRIALGQVSVIVSFLLVAGLLGLIPDRDSAVLDGRSALAEVVALNSSIYLTRSDLKRMEADLQLILTRNPDIISAGIRQSDGKLITTVGEHQLHWQTEQESTHTQIRVPILEREKTWGHVELRFTALRPEGLLGYLLNPIALLVSFFSITCYIVFYFYLGKMLKHLDPSQAIPERVKSALDTMIEGLLVLDAKQNIVLANTAFASLMKTQPEKLLGHKVNEFDWANCDDSDFDNLYSPWSMALADSVAQTGSMMRLQLENETRTFMVNCSPVMGSSNKASGVLVSFDDVTELEEKELELKKSKEEAERANRAKSDFLANMSHEIRTPMNAILGFTEVLKRGYNKNAADSRKYLNTIASSGNHLLDLINDILDLSKVEAGRIEVEKIACPVHHTIQEVIEIMQARAQEKGISLTFLPIGPLPAQIQSDPARLRQILTNLVGNAIKFTEKGSVKIITHLDRDKAQSKENNTLTIEVVDTGIGMSAEQAANVFEPFVQADSSITRRFGGTGLGLTISKRFAEALDGDLAIHSEPGKGSKFTLTLKTGSLTGIKLLDPNEVLLENVAKPTPEQRWLFPSANVLIVDDGEENRELLQVILEDVGLQVDCAENGKIACDKVNSKSFDTILMDVEMPVMDGYTAAQQIRNKNLNIPIIALTAHAMKGVAEKCLAAGFSDYLTKPIDIDQLLELLAKALGGKATTEKPAKSTVPLAKTDETPHVPSSANTITDNQANMDRKTYVIPTIVTSRLPSSNKKFRVIQEKFVQRLSTQLNAIDQNLVSKNFDELAKLAHWIKGSAGSVGFDVFTEPAADMEQFAKQSQLELMKESVAAIRELQKRIVIAEKSETGSLNKAVTQR